MTPVATVLARSERPDPVLTAAEVATWPAGLVTQLVRLGVFARASPAESYACDACGFDHIEPVEWVRVAGLDPRVCIRCAEAGLVWLDPAVLDRWAVRLPVLAQSVASALGTAGSVAERVPGRVWTLGTVRIGERPWVGHLALGLTRHDAIAVVERVSELRAPNALVFVPSGRPAESVWSSERAPAILSLCDLLALGPKGLEADRDFLASALPSAKRALPKGPARVFPTPPGTTWEEITLMVEDRHLCIQVATVVERFGFTEAGFEDRRANGTPNELWVLLGVLALFRGELRTGDRTTTKPGALKSKVSALRDRLRALLALDGDPFHPSRRGRPYRTRFTIRRGAAATFPTPPETTWGDLTVTETVKGALTVGITTEVRGAAVTSGPDGAGDRWVATTVSGERQFTYTLTDLGLTGPDGTPTPAGAALVAVLRAGGRLERRPNDNAVVALGTELTRFFQLDEPPFTFDTKRRVWVAAFEAASFRPASDR